jgi:hypothetical protein
MRERHRRPVNTRHVIGVSFGGRGRIGGDQQLVVRHEARGAVDDIVLVEEQSGARETRSKLRTDEFVDACPRDGNSEQKEPEQHGQLVTLAEPPQVRGQLGRPREQLVARSEPLLDARRLVAGAAQQPSELDRGLRVLGARRIRARRGLNDANRLYRSRRANSSCWP